MNKFLSLPEQKKPIKDTSFKGKVISVEDNVTTIVHRHGHCIMIDVTGPMRLISGKQFPATPCGHIKFDMPYGLQMKYVRKLITVLAEIADREEVTKDS